MLIIGTRRTIQQLAMVMLFCSRHGGPAAHSVRKAVTKLTFFFIPLFPVSTRHQVQCTFCGAAGGVGREEAERLAAGPPPGHDQPGRGGPAAPLPPWQGEPGMR